MMREEFEKLTGIYPTVDMYDSIEEAYMEFNSSKQEFCKAYKANENSMAEAMQRKRDMANVLASSHEKADSEKCIADLTARIANLEAKLEREQEWKPYFDPSQAYPFSPPYPTMAAPMLKPAVKWYNLRQLTFISTALHVSIWNAASLPT